MLTVKETELGLGKQDWRKFVTADLGNSNSRPKRLEILNRIVKEASLK